ncbi:MAG TPA: BtrH N-terminal domain-containing protein [Candidatus Deferrimicrobiaceae bacterium]|nr:BtrH N-terminal domain-containing protein [Candidatus Deferrimicrobiaceae bacterium]
MRYAVPGYVHRPGLHCGSSAMRNLLAFRGIDLSEPMCFGLGSGAGFLYVPALPVSPGLAFHGRILEMERELCDALAIPFPERPEKDGDAGWKRAREAVRSGHPVLINTDLAHLDYFETTTHFSGHRIVLFGFDDEEDCALLSDSEREEPQKVPVRSLKLSRSSSVPPYPMENRWCIVRPEGPLRPLPEAVPLALAKNARAMLSPPGNVADGVSGIRRMAGEIRRWPEMTGEWAFAARFGYQIIEKRGTGGGLFRRIYARYLDEAASHHPPLAGARLAEKMVPVAEGWTKIAGRLKEISEEKNPGSFSRLSDPLLRQADMEQAFWEEAASVA